jgi:hypothetical protein
MEFYPDDLVKEFPEVELDINKQTKFKASSASINVVNDPINKYFKWN